MEKTYSLILLSSLIFFSLNLTSQASSANTASAVQNIKSQKTNDTIKFDTSSLENAIRESIKEAGDNPEVTKEKIKNDNDLVEYTRQLSFWTEFLAIVTALLAGIAVFQIWMFYRQLQLMNTATKDSGNSAKAAQVSADAARVAADSYRTSERAWMGSSTIHAVPFFKAYDRETGEPLGDGLQVSMEWLNAGRTPAINCGIRIHVTGDRLKQGDPISTMKPSSNPIHKHAPILPGTTVMSEHRMITKDQLAELRAGNIRVFIYGRAEYKTVFSDESLPYSDKCTDVCYQLMYAGKKDREDGDDRFATINISGSAN